MQCVSLNYYPRTKLGEGNVFTVVCHFDMGGGGGWYEVPSEQGCHGTGKTGNLKVHFSRQGKHREFAKNIKNMFLHREFTTNTGKI